MSVRVWLSMLVAVSVLSGVAFADPPAKESTIEARMRALERRISDLEQKASESPSAELERRVSALEKKAGEAPAAPGALEQRVSTLEKKTSAPAPAVAGGVAAPAIPAGPPRWKNSSNWASLRLGMTWSQVKQILGVPGKVQAGVFGDVMFFPDSNGGRVEFDRDGRVAKWSEKPGE